MVSKTKVAEVGASCGGFWDKGTPKINVFFREKFLFERSQNRELICFSAGDIGVWNLNAFKRENNKFLKTLGSSKG